MDQEKSPVNESQALVKETIPKKPKSPYWFSSFVDSAKEKSNHALEFMKRDLIEFKETVRQNTSAAFSSTANIIGETISSLNAGNTNEEALEKKVQLLEGKETGQDDNPKVDHIQHQNDVKPLKEQKDMVIDYLSTKAKSLFTSLVNVMAIVDYEDDEDDICVKINDKIISIERGRWDMLIKAIQSDPETYCHEPKGFQEDYENWLASFNLSDYESKIQNLLEKSSEVKSFYKQLVPSSLSSDEFWHRYFYKLFQLRQLEFKRLALKAESDSKLETQESTLQEQSFTLELQEKLEKTFTTESKNNVSSVTNEDEQTRKKMPNEQKRDKEKIESVASSSSSSDFTKQSEENEDWEKAELGDIVDEAAKKLARKLNENLEKSENHDICDWEWE